MSMLAALFTIAWAGPAEAPPGWALVVGSNRPGPGQAPLQYAGADAERVADVLIELGGYDPERVTLLADPDADALAGALDALESAIAARRADDGQATALFYYSGHARAAALDLGPEQVPLEDLRARLEGMGATTTLVVIDACQSGAFSGIKGVTPAASFSWNATRWLAPEGFVVMASSTGSELSQESAELDGSFFTHHLVAGLRGAADVDLDGAVTLSEAYRYAYHRTLIDTAETAVGSQHVTLETDLRGSGEMVLTWPEDASARLVLGEDLQGAFLLHDADERVIAEVQKARGERMAISVAPGGYGVVARVGGAQLRCELALYEAAELDLTECAPVPEAHLTTKGAPERARVALEGQLGVHYTPEDAFIDSLQMFGYSPAPSALLHGQGALAVGLGARWSAVGAFGRLETASAQTDRVWTDEETPESERTEMGWAVWRMSAALRFLPAWDSGPLTPYVQAGVGPAWGSFRSEGARVGERMWGPQVSALAGIYAMTSLGERGLAGAYTQVEVIRAQALEGPDGKTRQSGGFSAAFGLRLGI